MSRNLRILILEDNPADAELMTRELGRAGIEFTALRVESEKDFQLQVREFRPEVILADPTLPAYDGFLALAEARCACPGTPFIVVSGTIGEELAVEALKKGAADYLPKDRLWRLGAAIRQAIEAKRLQTKAKRTEEALRRSEERFRRLADNARDVVFRMALPDGHYEYISPAVTTISGYTPEEFYRTPKLIEKLIHPSWLPRFYEQWTEVMNGRMPESIEFPYIHKSGQTRWAHQRSVLVFDEHGRVAAIEGIVSDVTEIKESMEKIRDQAALLDLTQDAIVVADFQGRLSYWNKGAEKIYGWAETEVIGCLALHQLYQVDLEELADCQRETIRNSRYAGELKGRTKSGQIIMVQSRWTLMRDCSGNPKSILIVDTDITEKKKIEAQFLRAQRMEGIGRLASGIAHDLNNVLTPILVGLPMLSDQITGEPQRRLLETLQSSAARGVDIVKQVLTFGRGAEGQKSPVQLRYLIHEMAKIIRETFPRSLELKTEVADDLWTISGDVTQLHQVLMNLCLNASDAMPEGGLLSLAAHNVRLGEDFARLNPDVKPGRYVLLEVTDTGCGIPPDHLEKIFDPFFTTKGPDKGSGLGLSTVLGIVKSHDGFIQLDSRINQGAHFSIFLPAAEFPSPSAKAKSSPPPRGRGELILVVDDEKGIRAVIQKILVEYGYRILAAGDGIEAIDLYNQNRDEIRAALIDLVMPVMDGQSTIRALRKLKPNLPIIATSGRGAGFSADEATSLAVHAFLPKPFNKEMLLLFLRQAIEAK
ncbi:MAG: response regulator [Candidatus Omnitrophica bacterium]|nr:response regulator [Candidatus Omnitrophota bacterium]